MVAQILSGEKLEPQHLERITNILKTGGVVILPTETIYGLSASIDSPDALRRIFELKGRGEEKPLIVLIATADSLQDYVHSIPLLASRIAARLWPGPLTLILPRSPRISLLVTGGRETVAIRVSSHPLLRQIISEVGPIVSTSANRSGEESPRCVQDIPLPIREKVDLIVDEGRCKYGVESTIIDVSAGDAKLVRKGALSWEEIAKILDRRGI